MQNRGASVRADNSAAAPEAESWERLNRASWTFGDVSTVGYFTGLPMPNGIASYTERELADMVLEPSVKGLVVAVPLGIAPPVTVPENTALALFRALSEAVNAPLVTSDPEANAKINERLDMFFRPEPLPEKRNRGELTTRDLMGDHKFWEGLRVDERTGVAYVSRGS